MTAFTSVPRFQVQSDFLARMRARFGKTIRILLLIGVPLLLLRGCATTYVAPDQVGLRQISFGPHKGLQKQLVGSGYRRQIIGYERIFTFPRDLQVIEFTNNPVESEERHR